MLSLSNYLTNRSETALISAYCSAWLNAASLGGLSGKLWYGAQQARQADKGEQQACAVRSQRPQRHIRQSEQPPSGVVQLVMALLNASLHFCSIHGGESYWIANSQRLDKKPIKDSTSFSSVLSLLPAVFFFTWQSLVALFCGIAAKNNLDLKGRKQDLGLFSQLWPSFPSFMMTFYLLDFIAWTWRCGDTPDLALVR